LISCPSSASNRATSSSGNSVNRRRKRPTSASIVLRQNCQNSYGLRISAFSQTAPSALLPIFAPSAVAIRGVVMPNN